MAIDTIKATAILDGSVDTADLADNAVTTAKITDGNITGAKIGDGEVTSAKIGDDEVTSAKLDTNIAIAGTLDVSGVLSTTGHSENQETVTSSSNAATLDLSSATNFTHTLTENVTYTFSNPASSGSASAFTLKVTQDSTARTITWPSSVDWAGGTAPTISTDNGAVDYFVFITTDGGTTYYGFTAGQALATPA